METEVASDKLCPFLLLGSGKKCSLPVEKSKKGRFCNLHAMHWSYHRFFYCMYGKPCLGKIWIFPNHCLLQMKTEVASEKTCPFLLLESGKKCGRAIKDARKGRFCNLHAMHWSYYHRFDFYYMYGKPCLALLGKSFLSHLTILLRNDLKEAIYDYIKASPQGEVYYEMAEREDIQDLISRRVKEYLSPDWKKGLVSRIAPKAKVLGPGLLSGKLPSTYDPEAFNNEDRLANILIKMKSDQKNYQNIAIQALFLVMALEEIVLQERLEAYIFYGGRKIPQKKGDDGDVSHCIPVIECKAIIAFFRSFLPKDKDGGKTLLVSTDWEMMTRHILSYKISDRLFDKLLPVYRHEEALAEEITEKICRMGKSLEQICFSQLSPSSQKNSVPLEQICFSLSQIDSAEKRKITAKSLFEITTSNIAKRYGIETSFSFPCYKEVFFPLRTSFYEETVYSYFYWKKETDQSA